MLSVNLERLQRAKISAGVKGGREQAGKWEGLPGSDSR